MLLRLRLVAWVRARILFQSTDQKHEEGENLKAKISDLENRFHKLNIQIIRISEGKKRKKNINMK